MPDKKQELYELLREVPKGKVTTYKILAKKLKIHPRTAGIFLGQNKYPKKYPCYKVVASDGKLGGYSGVGGVKKKIELLRKGGIEIEKGKIKDLEKVLCGSLIKNKYNNEPG
jgi:O-6-methylguanine DNA methyltransferase